MSNPTTKLSFSELLLDEQKRNWPEDFIHENGNYLNICVFCKHDFLGHKRRVVCKSCFQEKQLGYGE